MTTITGEFSVELTPQQDGVNTGRMLIQKSFKGDLEGISEGQMLSIRTDTPGSAGYVAIETFTGTLFGKAGTFSLQHMGVMNRGEQSLTIVIVPDSGSDNLEGIQGNMHIDMAEGKHLYTLTYSLPDNA